MQLEGRHPVMEALENQRKIEKLMIADGVKGAFLKKVEHYTQNQHIPLQKVARRVLDDMSLTHNHQGIIAIVPEVGYCALDELLAQCQAAEQVPFILMLDHIEDPHNLGSILRTAETAGVQGVIIPKRRAAGITPVVARVSAGAMEYVPVTRVANLAQAIKQLKAEGFWICATDAQAPQYIYEVDLTIPLVLIIGSEGKGISRLLLEKSDFIVKIPMSGKISSLNAGVAAGICTFEVVRQRHVK